MGVSIRVWPPLILGLVMTAGCAGHGSPVAPTNTSATTKVAGAQVMPLMVSVKVRGSEQPIAGAMVRQNDRPAGETDDAGTVRTTVPLDAEFHIDVTAPGFVGEGAWGSVASEEHWTFYLARAQ